MVGPEEQNIEYTQYMPGSLQTKDQGQHLGANRISKQIAGVSLRMEDPVAARTFYEQKLGFHESLHPLEPGLIPLLLPGPSGQMVEITPGATRSSSPFPAFGSVAASLRHAYVRSESKVHADRSGSRWEPLVFVTIEPETGRKLLQMPKISMDNKVIISCAVTGSIHTPTMSPYLPFKPEDIARQAIEAAEAGAAILHFHARDPRTGEPTADPACSCNSCPSIKAATNAVINISTGGGLT